MLNYRINNESVRIFEMFKLGITNTPIWGWGLNLNHIFHNEGVSAIYA